MSRALGPAASTAPGGTAAAWVVLAVCWALAALNGLIWAAAASPRRSPGAGWSRSARDSPVMSCAGTRPRPGRIPRPWPSPCSRSSCSRSRSPVLPRLWWLIARHRPAPGDPVAALARNPRIRVLTRLPIAQTAVKLRRSLAGADPRGVHPAEAGLALGRLMRTGRASRRPGGVRVVGRHRGRVHGAPVGEDDRAGDPVRPVRARPGHRDLEQVRPVGGHRRAARAGDGRAGVAVRPAAHHLPAPGLVVEPPRRSCGPSRTPTGSPGTSSSPSPTSTAVTCGAPLRRTCWPRCSWRPPRMGSPCTTWPGG